MRCSWAKSEVEVLYHDNFWGKPVHDEQQLFKMLILEGQQAGLSWRTILNKMAALEQAYEDFDPLKLIQFDESKVASLLANPQIIRNKRKVQAAINNAHAYFNLCETYQSLDSFLWTFVDNQPLVNFFESQSEVPTQTLLSQQISQELKKMGFQFVGPTIIYAYMEAIGMVNNHLVSCEWHQRTINNFI